MEQTESWQGHEIEFYQERRRIFYADALGLQLVRDKIAQQRMLRLMLDKRSKFHQLPDQLLEIIFRLTVECPEHTSGF